MKLSVIIPIYNVNKYIEKCIKSINNQTLNSKLFELIFVDDQSLDNSIEILKNTINQKLNYKILSKPNGGLSDARNFGVLNSSFEYIMFIDSDDFVHELFFENMLKKIEKDKSDFVVCETSWVYENKNVVYKNKISKPKNQEEILDNLFTSSIAAWNKIYRREIFNDFLFTKDLLFEDLDFMFKIINKYNKITFLNEALYFYNQINEKSILSTSSVKDFSSYENIMLKNIKKYKNTKYFKYVEQYYIRRVLLSLVKKYVGSDYQNNLTNLINELNPYFNDVFKNYEYISNSLAIKIWIKLAVKKNWFILKLIKIIMV